jgi:hypothetical protein
MIHGLETSKLKLLALQLSLPRPPSAAGSPGI